MTHIYGDYITPNLVHITPNLVRTRDKLDRNKTHFFHINDTEFTEDTLYD